MPCPFLQDTRVRYCTASAMRKMIVDSGKSQIVERCSSPAYHDCAVYREHAVESETSAACPHLRDSHAHYCAASPVTKLVPYSDQAGRCGTPGYRYCAVYLAFADPHTASTAGAGINVQGIRVPNDVHFAPNHMWVHTDSGGSCYVGVDGFLARLLGRVDSITFVTPKGVHRPGVVLSFRGIDWQFVFPAPMLISGANVYLRRAPERLTADPYGVGWLYEGWEMPAPGPRIVDGLLDAERATAWMTSEIERLDECIHRVAAARPGAPKALLNDGGGMSADAISELTRDELIGVLSEFVSPLASWGGNER